MLKLLEKLGLSQTCSNTESERFLSTVRDRPAKAENDATSFASVSNNLVAIVLSFSVSPTLQQLNQYETYKSAKGFDLKFQISDSYLRSIAFRSVHWWLSGGSFGIARRGRAFSVDRAACRSAVRSGFLGHRSPSVAKNATGPDRCTKQAISEAACRRQGHTPYRSCFRLGRRIQTFASFASPFRSLGLEFRFGNAKYAKRNPAKILVPVGDARI